MIDSAINCQPTVTARSPAACKIEIHPVMSLLHLLTPIAEVPSLSMTDTVREAFARLERARRVAAPIVDRNGRYVATITEADLRRHVTKTADRINAFAAVLSQVQRGAQNAAVTIDRGVASIIEQATRYGFVPVVDATRRLLGIIDRRRLLAAAAT